MKEFYCAEQLYNEAVPAEANAVINTECDRHIFMEGEAFPGSTGIFAQKPDFAFEQTSDNTATVTVTMGESELKEDFRFFASSGTIRQVNRLINHTNVSLPLLHVSSGRFSFPWKNGILPWTDPRRFRIHWCESSWMAEGQWKEGSFADLGMAPVRTVNHGMQSVRFFTLRSEGSWSTGRHYPLLIVEDRETGYTYYMEHEGGLSWEMTLSVWGDNVTLEANSADVHHDLWYHELAPGETYETTAVLYGRVAGTFEDAVAELTRAKREASLTRWKNGVIPVCYNVFMGALFGEPTEKNLLPLIRAAAEAGCEVFCIDAGWYRPAGDPTKYNLLGDYIPDSERFGAGGLKGILDSIRAAGMVPGLWFEFEASNCHMVGSQLSDTAMIKRNGHVISPERCIYDLCDPKVREHLFAAVDAAYRLGMRYIKNDHNFSTGTGFGDKGDCFSMENRKRMDALYSFVDELYRRYPDLIIENCGSGGQRSDHGTLKHFHLQSTSDQELYFNYPAILAGVGATMEPEKAGNWGYPYAITDGERKILDTTGENREAIIDRSRDGEATVFSMINASLGAMYLSGRLELADDKNRALIREAVDLYKQNRAMIAGAVPVFPTGMPVMGQPGFITYGLKNGSELLLAVWRVQTKEETAVVPLGRFGAKRVEQIYPREDDASRFVFAPATGTLTVQMRGSENMGRLYKVTL